MNYNFLTFRSVHSLALTGLLALLCLYACRNDGQPSEPADLVLPVDNQSMDWAQGFKILEDSAIKRLHLYTKSGSRTDSVCYLLYDQGVNVPAGFEAYTSIPVPAKRIAVLHSSYLAYFQVCGAMESVKAISESKYIYDPEMYQAIEEGSIIQVGYGEGLNKEMLLAMEIDLVINVGFPDTPGKEAEFLASLGIPMIVFTEWQETHPLGRAEWVKVVGVITGKDSVAETYFNKEVENYKALQQMANNTEERPVVICNLPYKGAWYVPGGNSYMSNLLSDAGGLYAWIDNPETGGVQMAFEAVYTMGLVADYWINPGFSHSVTEILDKDERLADFKAIKSGKIYNNTRRLQRGEANDYWESGLVRPHLILSDLVSILHPELDRPRDLFYYLQIQ